jgi:hypothetical protein
MIPKIALFSILTTGCFCLFVAGPAAIGETADDVGKSRDQAIPFRSDHKFSPWLRPSEFATWLKKMPDGQYLMVIQGAPVQGDGVDYRALLMEKPTKATKSEFVYGVKKIEFDRRHEELRKKGYVLIQHHVVQLYSHQAVWLKND